MTDAELRDRFLSISRNTMATSVYDADADGIVDDSTKLGAQVASYYIDWTNFTNTPTTLAGYGITDVFDGTFASLTNKPTTSLGYGITDAFDGYFSSLINKPTTLAGYGITEGFVGTWDSLVGKPVLATVATTGSYNHLLDKPDLNHIVYWSGIQNKPTTLAGYGITDGGGTSSGGGSSLMTAADILASLITVDGTGSGLDADLLDGAEGALYARLASPTFTGNVTMPGTGIWNSSGNVGIGTTTVPKKLTVSVTDNNTEINSARTAVIKVNNDSSTINSFSGTAFGSVAGNEYIFGMIGTVLTDVANYWAGDMVFGVKANNSATTVTEYMRIKVGGNVGIGTASPSYLLYVKKDITTANFQAAFVNQTYDGIFIGNSGSGGYAGIPANTPMIGSDYNAGGSSKGLGIYVAGGLVLGMYINTSGYVGIGFTSPLSKLAIDGGLHVGGASDAGDNNLFVDGIAQEPNFTTGFQGTNWQISAAGNAEFGNMRIRGGLEVYELIINQLHYQNGGLIIGAGAGKIKTIDTATVGSERIYFETPEGVAMVPFTTGAIVMMQRVDIDKTTVVKKIVRQVSNVIGNLVYFTTTTGWTTASDVGIFGIGDEVVTIGHTITAALQNSIYMSAIDADNPFMRVFAGVNSYAKWSLGDKSTIKLQLGNLASLASYDILPASPGYGLYSDNVFLKGKIVASSGAIGGWVVDANSIKDVAGTVGLSSAVTAGDDIRFFAGHTDSGLAPFRVTETGSLTAKGIAELGTAANASGYGLAIRGGDIWENLKNANSITGINYHGYSDGTTQYRTTTIYDGKEKVLFSCQGGTPLNNIIIGNSLAPTANITSIYGDVTIAGNVDVDPSYTFKAKGNAVFDGDAVFNTKIRVPDLASAPSLPTRGMIYVSSASGRFYGYNGTGWVLLDYNP